MEKKLEIFRNGINELIVKTNDSLCSEERFELIVRDLFTDVYSFGFNEGVQEAIKNKVSEK